MSETLLSIVIANYNYGRFLEDAITSVVNQCERAEKCADGVNRLLLSTGEYVELIICDALSGDNSLDVIKKYENYLAWWCSEKDKGQSDAFIKGFSHASGRFLTWLNADDVFIGDIFKRVSRAVQMKPTQEWFACGCVCTDPDMRIRKCTFARRFSDYEASCGNICVYSPSSFFSKALYERVCGINRAFKAAMDTELWFKFYFTQGVRYEVIPGFAFAFRFHPLSRTTGNKFKESPIANKDHPFVAEFENDMRMLREEFPNGNNRTTLHTLLNMQWMTWIASRIITALYRGKNITSIYKR